MSEEVAIARATDALGRAEAVLRFVSDADERLVEELQALCDGVRVLVTHAQAG